MEAILADQTIKGLFKSNVVERTVTHVPSGFVVKIIAPEVKAAAGLRPVLTILDEVAIASHEREYAACVDQLRRGSRNWPDSLEVAITTADPARPVGHYKTELAYARGVRDGLIKDESFLPILYEFPVLERPELDVTDPQEWWRGLPSVGHTIALAELQDEYREAQAKGSLDMRNFLSQRLGVESDVIAASDESDSIQSLWARGVVTADESTMQQADVVVIGNDPGGIADPHGVCILWRANGSLHAIVKQFCVQSAVDNADAEAKAVFDRATLADELFVFDQVTQMDEGIVGLISQIVADVHGGIGCPVIIGGDLYGRAGFSQMLAQTTGMEYRKAQQGFVSGSALSQLEGLIHDGMIKVTGGPLLDSNFTNLKVDEKGQTRRIGKADGWLSGAGHRHIDGVSALLSALTLLSEAPPAFDVSCLIASA
jgi:phage terminase large subunit-like protein